MRNCLACARPVASGGFLTVVDKNRIEYICRKCWALALAAIRLVHAPAPQR